jgi:hypothetical protein
MKITSMQSSFKKITTNTSILAAGIKVHAMWRWEALLIHIFFLSQYSPTRAPNAYGTKETKNSVSNSEFNKFKF